MDGESGTIQIAALNGERITQLRSGFTVGWVNIQEGRRQTWLGKDALILIAAAQYGQGRFRQAGAFNQHDGHFIGRSEPKLTLKTTPQLVHFVERERLGRDPHPLDLVVRVGELVIEGQDAVDGRRV